MLNCSHNRHRGFTLTEIAVAIGIVTFALIAIVSLFSSLLVTERGTVSRMVVPQITSEVLHQLRKNLVGNTYYFDDEGNMQEFGSNAVYKCEATLLSAGVGSLNPGAYTQLAMLEIYNVNGAKPSKTVFATVRAP